MDELTKLLIGKDFGVEGTEIPIFYVSHVTGKEYSYENYNPKGDGGPFDLPKDEYPYGIIYKKRNG
jgi:hypothetical protein